MRALRALGLHTCPINLGLPMSNDLTTRLTFPVLCVSVWQAIVEPSGGPDELTHCSYYALSKGWFKELELYDNAGRYFLVESVSLKGNPGWLKRAWMRVVNARCKVVYDSVRDLGTASLGDVKSRLSEMAEINREMIESAWPFEEFLAKLTVARTFEDLCKLYR